MALPSYSYHQPGQEKKGSSDCCSLSCLKFFLYMYNIVLLLFGLSGLAVGLWTLLDRGQFLSLLTSSTYHISGILVLVSGVLVVGITVLGCCGISREGKGLILAYSGLLAFTIIVQVAVGVTAYLYRAKVHQELVVSLNTTFTQEYGMMQFNLTTEAVDDLQTTLKCCGAESYEDWRNSLWWSQEVKENNKVPDSCCKSVSRFCGVRDHPSNIYYTGCAHKLSRMASDHLLLIGSIALVICAVEACGVVLSATLVRKLSKLDD